MIKETRFQRGGGDILYPFLKIDKKCLDLGIKMSELCPSKGSHPEVFSAKVFLKICSTFTGEHPYQSVISIKSQGNFIKITLRHECSSLNVLHIFKTRFLIKTSGRLLLSIFGFNFPFKMQFLEYLGQKTPNFFQTSIFFVRF